MKKRVLVTGAAGFLGQPLLKLLQDEGAQITGTYLRGMPLSRQTHVCYEPLNILTSSEVTRIFSKVKPDWVFHLAALTIPRNSWQDIQGTFEANVRGTLNILDSARRQLRPPRIFFASTIQVYGKSFHQEKALDERATLWPESPYAASKAVAELAALDYGRKFNLDIVIGRFANSVGRGQPAALVFPEWCRKISELEKDHSRAAHLETGNLEVWRDFLHAQDTARAMLLLMKKGRAGTIYNVASAAPKKLKVYADYLIAQSTRKIKLKAAPSLLRKGEPGTMTVCSDRLRKLGWRPKQKVEAGLLELLQDWRSR